MLSRKALAIATLSTIVCTQAGLADEAFKSSKFLTYSAEQQKNYINISMVIVSLVASQNSRSYADCLNNWSAKNVESGYQPVIEAIKDFPTTTPPGLSWQCCKRNAARLNSLGNSDYMVGMSEGGARPVEGRGV